jgi:hypothetical protein
MKYSIDICTQMQEQNLAQNQTQNSSTHSLIAMGWASPAAVERTGLCAAVSL